GPGRPAPSHPDLDLRGPGQPARRARPAARRARPRRAAVQPRGRAGAVRGGHRQAGRGAAAADRGRGAQPDQPATDAGGAVPAPLRGRWRSRGPGLRGCAGMTGSAARPGTGRRAGNSPVAGAGLLTKLALRRDRIMLPAWIYVLTALIAGNVYSFKTLFATAAERDKLVASAGSTPAFQFLYGRLYSTSVGGLTAWRYGVYVALGAGLMSTFLVIRHTRAEEEAGRTELAGSTAVGRHASLAAGLLVAAAAN